VRTTQMLMNFKYRNFQAQGYKAITKQPAIYVSAASKYARDDLRELLSIQVTPTIQANQSEIFQIF
jgi:hypothetical protein